jgi:hypothetical protein
VGALNLNSGVVSIAGDPPLSVIAGLDPAIHTAVELHELAGEPRLRHVSMDARVIGERSDAVLRTATPADDEDEDQTRILRNGY